MLKRNPDPGTEIMPNGSNFYGDGYVLPNLSVLRREVVADNRVDNSSGKHIKIDRGLGRMLTEDGIVFPEPFGMPGDVHGLPVIHNQEGRPRQLPVGIFPRPIACKDWGSEEDQSNNQYLFHTPSFGVIIDR